MTSRCRVRAHGLKDHQTSASPAIVAGATPTFQLIPGPKAGAAKNSEGADRWFPQSPVRSRSLLWRWRPRPPYSPPVPESSGRMSEGVARAPREEWSPESAWVGGSSWVHPFGNAIRSLEPRNRYRRPSGLAGQRPWVLRSFRAQNDFTRAFWGLTQSKMRAVLPQTCLRRF